MKPVIIFIAFLCTLSSSAQDLADSLLRNKNFGIIAPRIDSVSTPLSNLPGGLRNSQAIIDSIRNAFNDTVDSLKTGYKNTVSSLNTQSDKLQSNVDSLSALNLSTSFYTKRLDSLQHLALNTKTKYNSKLQALKSKTTEQLNDLDLPEEFKQPLQKLTADVNNLNLDTDIVAIPQLRVPGYDLPKLDAPGLSSLNGISDAPSTGSLPNIGKPADEVGSVTQQIGSYQDDIKSLTGGKLANVESIPEAIESQATKVEGIGELQKQSGVIDGHKAKLDELKDPSKGKEKAVELAKKAAVDHFAGKQEQLKTAMEKISKYKQKYSSVPSIKELPKRPPNPMKSKPFIERLVPGLYFQYQQKNFYLLDVNPYLGYKLTGRFTTGLGWNHRFAWDKKHKNSNERTRIFGPRAYVDFKLGKGFIAHLEGESMNSFVPSVLHGNPDAGHREWVWSLMTGLKKEYKIYKNLKGTALIQYNLFNRYYKAPYVDRLNSRIGFEYTLKKAKKKKS